ncbi:hypothetical protein [Bacillus glycinifermentans]|uniref:Uncharacterized protein n=1 Tax=Bacillus glycinifermentans TaxID=1664069 RepID=A0ABU6GZE1_9BACI|nr:hypothetical protein [Bacillus glycinifermentans]MEC0484123.1 hypothetical protein [Bacillus glycinifermentans]MEC0494237.1 hypothetical protein [Bacillus glycinifermentans]MEC0540652.1 hypothetical protein [Bacillus glycinifermentans]
MKTQLVQAFAEEDGGRHFRQCLSAETPSISYLANRRRLSYAHSLQRMRAS